MEMNNNDPTFGSLTVIIRKKLSKAGNFNYPLIYYFPSFIEDKLRYVFRNNSPWFETKPGADNKIIKHFKYNSIIIRIL